MRLEIWSGCGSCLAFVEGLPLLLPQGQKVSGEQSFTLKADADAPMNFSLDRLR